MSFDIYGFDNSREGKVKATEILQIKPETLAKLPYSCTSSKKETLPDRFKEKLLIQKGASTTEVGIPYDHSKQYLQEA